MTVVQSQTDVVAAQARIFLWTHWRDRKRAYLIHTASSVDSTSTSHVFVEQDYLGRWRIYWRSINRTRVNDSPTDYAMAWVHPDKWDQPGIPLRQGHEPDPVRDRLEFKDVCGDYSGKF